jgi:hypothetical protein
MLTVVSLLFRAYGDDISEAMMHLISIVAAFAAVHVDENVHGNAMSDRGNGGRG